VGADLASEIAKLRAEVSRVPPAVADAASRIEQAGRFAGGSFLVTQVLGLLALAALTRGLK
jgi:hypothetical protein